MTRVKSVCCLLAALVLLPLPAVGSDHADPLLLFDLEAGITGLFAWRDGDALAVILTVSRGLRTAPPYELEDFEYTVHMDLDSLVSFKGAEHNARYGGRVRNPAGIEEDVTIRMRLENEADAFRRGYPETDGTLSLTGVESRVGVFDDPFIFPRFAEANVVAMVLRIPLANFPPDQEDWLIWATTHKDGWFGKRQVDHVGRSARTQLGRFDFLNKLHPNEHVAAIKGMATGWQSKVKGFFMGAMLPGLGAGGDLFQYVLAIREQYDYEPDVMIFTTGDHGEGYPSSYPNGRRLDDDIVALTCEQGDCVLQEVASYEAGKTHKPHFLEENVWPRKTVHQAAFSADFPYLPAHHPYDDETEPRRGGPLQTLLIVLVVAFLIWFDRFRRKADEAEKPWVRKRSW